MRHISQWLIGKLTFNFKEIPKNAFISQWWCITSHYMWSLQIHTLALGDCRTNLPGGKWDSSVAVLSILPAASDLLCQGIIWWEHTALFLESLTLNVMLQMLAIRIWFRQLTLGYGMLQRTTCWRIRPWWLRCSCISCRWDCGSLNFCRCCTRITCFGTNWIWGWSHR